MNRNGLKRRHPRGTAATELSILMVALIPLIMYTLFLEDLLSYKLENQEPVVSAPWDYMVYNFATPIEAKGKNDLNNTVRRSNARTFCDHTAAYNTYGNVSADCQDAKHHGGAAVAHQCWVTGDAAQLSCSLDGAVGDAQVSISVAGRAWYDSFNKGGLATCTARLGVVNTFLPHKIFTWSAKKDDKNLMVSNTKEFSKDRASGGEDSEQKMLDATHGGTTDTEDGSTQTGRDVVKAKEQYVMRTEFFSVLHDPWALNAAEFTSDPKKGTGQMNPLQPNKTYSGHPLYERVNNYYGSVYGQIATTKADMFGMQLTKFLMPDILIDGLGDDVRTPPLAWKKDADRQFNSHYASGWPDSRVQDTNSARGNNYFSQTDNNYW